MDAWRRSGLEAHARAPQLLAGTILCCRTQRPLLMVCVLTDATTASRRTLDFFKTHLGCHDVLLPLREKGSG